MDDLDFGNTIKGFTPGQKVLNRYKLDRILGRGGMGVVWLARDEELDRDIALKFLPEVVALDAEAVADLKRETRRNLDLTHPHIVRIHDFVSDKRTAAIAMEYVKGATLATLKLERPGRVFPVAELRPWVEQFLEALHYAHTKAKVVHRDLKPANLMITDGGDLKITDFGIATSITDSVSRVSKQAGASGTPVYMSPQQMLGEKAAVTDDLYAVGATLYELLTSKPPFYSGNVIVQVQTKTAPSITERRKELEVDGETVPPEWEQTIAACLAKEPAQRPQSAGELSERLSLTTSAFAKATADRKGRKQKIEEKGRASRPDEPQVERLDPKTLSPAQGNALRSTRSTSKTPLYAALAAGVLLLGGLGWYFGVYAPEQKRLAEAARLESDRKAEEVRKLLAETERLDAAKKTVAEYTGAGSRGARFVSGIIRGFGEAATVTSLKVDRQKGLVEFRIPGKSAEFIKQRMDSVIEVMNGDSVVGYGSKFVLARLDEADFGHFAGTAEVNFTSAKGQPAASAFANEGLAKYQKVTLTMEVLALADGDIARDAGVPAAELVKANEMASNQQRFYQLEAATRTKLQDVRQLQSEGPSVTFRVSLEGSLTNALRFMQALEAGPWRIQYKEYSLVVAAPQATTATPAATKVAQPRADQTWENTLGQKFVPVPGTNVLFSIWETRVEDFEAFVRETSYTASAGAFTLDGNGSMDRLGGSWRNPGFAQTGQHPVTCMSHADAEIFCRWLTEKERREGRLGPDQVYRLPTHAEWLAAVGNNEDVLGTQWPPPKGAGNYADAAAKRQWSNWSVIDGFDDGYAGTSPVGNYAANRHGIYDLGGNVRERVGEQEYQMGASFCDGDVRGLFTPNGGNMGVEFRKADIGFRVVCAVGSASGEKSSAPAKPDLSIKLPSTVASKPVVGQKWTIPDLQLDLMPIAPGTFRMGSASAGDGDERPVTQVTIAKPYWLGKTEVTQAQWSTVMGSNPSDLKGDSLPVENVSWNEAMEFCRILTERERATGRLAEGHTYNLPTEAQWEYSCRAGATGDYAGNIDAMGWHFRNSGNTTHPVAQKQANAWGLHDMHGNVWEWCEDWKGDYPGGGVTDPTGSPAGFGRVYRGGSWDSTVEYCRSAERNWNEPSVRGKGLGFRLALASSSR